MISMHRSNKLDSISSTTKILRYMIMKQIGSRNTYRVLARASTMAGELTTTIRCCWSQRRLLVLEAPELGGKCTMVKILTRGAF